MDDDPVAAEGMRRASPAQELRELPVEEIEPNLSQPRRYLDEETLQELAGSIGERGVLQPVLSEMIGSLPASTFPCGTLTTESIMGARPGSLAVLYTSLDWWAAGPPSSTVTLAASASRALVLR